VTKRPPEIDVRPLLAIAQECVERGQYRTAADLLQSASTVAPGNRAIDVELRRIRRLQAGAPPTGQAKDPVQETARRQRIDASQYLGLAALLTRRSDLRRALQCVEAAKLRGAENATLHALEAQIHERLGQVDRATDSLHAARRLDPFDVEIAEQLGILEFERHRYREALALTVDAYLLCSEGGDERLDRLRRRLRTLRGLLGWATPQVVELFRERQEELQTSFDRLEWKQEQKTADKSEAATFLEAPQAPIVRRGQLALASRLRAQARFSHFSDEQIFLLTRAVREEVYPAGAKLTEQGASTTDLYLIESGTVIVQRQTPYGSFVLANAGAGELLGEINFIGRDQRSAEILAKDPTRVLRMNGASIERLTKESPDLGVHLYWTIWHSLASRLRSTNEQLRDFLPVANRQERGAKPGDTFAGLQRMELGEKIRLFREGGLSGDEIRTLAAFAQERRYPAGGHIFREGEHGADMFVIAEGRILISKFIPGGGEEALAILERGDFFGEMALIDGQPRSADAQAHGGSATVLALNESAIHELLGMDPRFSIDFLRLLCRLLAKRLREIDDKVTTWRIIASQVASETA